MRYPSVVAVPACLALALGVLGCGGSDDDSLTLAEYIKQADAICQKYEQLRVNRRKPKSVEDIPGVARETRKRAEDQLRELRALDEPDELRGQTTALYDLLETQYPLIDKLVAAAQKGDQQALSRVTKQAADLDEQSNAKTKALGLTICGGA